MKKKISSISIVLLSLLTSCSIPITNQNNLKAVNESTVKTKTSLSGKVQFPVSNLGSLKTKATLADIGLNATVSIIYPIDAPSNANKTVATSITDTLGNFIINPSSTFSPTNGEIFVLEAYKRIGSSGNSAMTVRTIIKWNGTTWDSITTPDVNINSKTTALSAMASLLSPSVSSSDLIGTINVSGNISTPTNINHLGTPVISSSSILKVADLVDYTISKNLDPWQYLVYQNGEFFLKDPNNILDVITSVPTITNTSLATSIVLNQPTGVTFDSLGNIYISENQSHLVRKVSTTGIITTVAGGGNFIGDGEQATNSKLINPKAVAFDSVGNMYIAEILKIRKVDKVTGIMTSIAGTGNSTANQGFSGDGGPATNAMLNLVYGLTLDSNNNIYIADYQNHRIRKVSTTGIITTVAGGGSSFSDGIQATNAQLNYPNAVKFDSLGNMYISEGVSNRIRKVSTTGIITTVAGGGSVLTDGGQATNAQLNSPRSIAFDSLGNMYISENGTNKIRKVSTIGIITTVAGTTPSPLYSKFSGDNGQATNAELDQPEEINFDNNGNLYISDKNNNRIRKVSTTGIITTVAGGGLSAVPSTKGSALDNSENIYIADNTNLRVLKIDKATGIMSTFAGTGSMGLGGSPIQATNAKFLSLNSVCTDSNGNLYIADSYNRLIRKVDKITGIISTFAGNGVGSGYVPIGPYAGEGGQATNAQLSFPWHISRDSNNNFYISDSVNIRKVSTTGIITTVVGNGTQGYSGDGGQATNAKLNLYSTTTVDANGNIYIADKYNHRIRKVDNLTGIITTIAGNGGYGYSGDGGQATDAQIKEPNQISLDSFGNIYISTDYRLRKIDKNTGIITTISGTGNSVAGGDNGPASSASLDASGGILFDSSGNIYTAGGGKVRKISSTPTVQP